MQLGMIGLGRMGGNMVIRLTKAGHECLVYDSHHEAVDALVAKGAKGTTGLPDFVKLLSKPRLVWLMVPAAVVDPVLSRSCRCWKRATSSSTAAIRTTTTISAAREALQAKGLHYVDVGVSGGVWGLERGYCHMIGGEPRRVQRLDPIFRSLAPGVDAAPRTPGANGEPGTGRAGLSALRAERRRALREDGPQRHRVRPDGGLCRGLNILQHANVGTEDTRGGRRDDAAAPPGALQIRHRYRSRSRKSGAAAAWSASWLLDLAASALRKSPDLGELRRPRLRFRRRPLDVCRRRSTKACRRR